MPGIPPELNQRLRTMLLRCGPFRREHELHAMFTDARIYAWRDHIASAATPAARVDALIDTLCDQKTGAGDNALALFLCVLAERYDADTACHHDLSQLAYDIAKQRVDIPAQATNPPQSDGDVIQQHINISGIAQNVMQIGKMTTGGTDKNK